MTCHRCGCKRLAGIPDSLAEACLECGCVFILGKDVGAPTIQEWAKDMHDAIVARDAQKSAQEVIDEFKAEENPTIIPVSTSEEGIGHADGA